MITLPVLDAPYQDLTTNLDGKDFALTLRYNQREGVYWVAIGLVGGSPIAWAKLVCNWPMFRNHTANDSLPPGALVCVPSGQDDSPPGLGELGPGKRCELVYLSASEVASL